MNYQQWLTNIRQVFKEIPDILMTIMSTYNALSVTSYLEFLQDILQLKREVFRPDNHEHLALDIPYLHNPRHQTMFILPSSFGDTIKAQLDYISSNQTTRWYRASSRGFNHHELDKMQRVYDLFTNYVPERNHLVNQQNFVRWADEHDRRRQTNLLKTFPEFSEFYNLIKSTL
jgi:hypothetical protein